MGEPMLVCLGLFGFGLAYVGHKYPEKFMNTWRMRLWTKMLGEERAVKAMKYVFAPLAFVFSGLILIGGLV